MIISTLDIEQAKKLIKQSSEKPIIVKAQNDIFNRKMLEYGKFNILLSVEAGQRKDSLRQLDSGLNHVLAKIAEKNHITLGIDLQDIAQLDKKDKALRLARIRQNIKLCKKTHTFIKILNAPSAQQAFSFLISLGASTQQAKEAIEQSP